MGKYDFELDLYNDNTLAWIAQAVEEKSVVLEFGAANGRLTKYLNQTKQCKIDIVEIDEESGSDAAVYAEEALLGELSGDIEKYLWLNLNKEYDYIIFADVLEHLHFPQEVLTRCKKILKKTGKILVSVPNVSHNSIIIDLINDKFNYTTTGLLDDTHLKMFTRQSFVSMAEKAGYAVVGEKPKYIRVGENEIRNTYSDVPKEVYKALIARETGDVYQYMFTLALSSEYILGECERVVCMDGTSFYVMEALYEHQGEYNYKKSANRQLNPNYKYIQKRLSVLPGSRSVRLSLINCNAVLAEVHFWIISGKERREVEHYKHNGKEINGKLYFIKENPIVEFELHPNDMEIEIDMQILKYDFEDEVIDELMDVSDVFASKIEEVIDEKNEVLQENKIIYEEMISQKDKEIRNRDEKIRNQEEKIRNQEERINQLYGLFEEKLHSICTKRKQALIPQIMHEIRKENNEEV